MGLFILSAVSGTGKSTIARGLVNLGARWRTSVSHTTRAPRGTEVDGVHYHFRSHDAFEMATLWAGRWFGSRAVTELSAL